jgi:hypothetical protein
MFSYNQSPLRWALLLVLLTPSLSVTDLQSVFALAPAVLLSVVLLWVMPTKVIVVAPEHIEEAIDEMEAFSIVGPLQVSVYKKSAEQFAEYLLEDMDDEECQ